MDKKAFFEPIQPLLVGVQQKFPRKLTAEPPSLGLSCFFPSAAINSPGDTLFVAKDGMIGKQIFVEQKVPSGKLT